MEKTKELSDALKLAKAILKCAKIHEASFSHKKARRLEKESKYPDYSSCYVMTKQDAAFQACLQVYGNTDLMDPVCLLIKSVLSLGGRPLSTGSRETSKKPDHLVDCNVCQKLIRH